MGPPAQKFRMVITIDKEPIIAKTMVDMKRRSPISPSRASAASPSSRLPPCALRRAPSIVRRLRWRRPRLEWWLPVCCAECHNSDIDAAVPAAAVAAPPGGHCRCAGHAGAEPLGCATSDPACKGVGGDTATEGGAPCVPVPELTLVTGHTGTLHRAAPRPAASASPGIRSTKIIEATSRVEIPPHTHPTVPEPVPCLGVVGAGTPPMFVVPVRLSPIRHVCGLCSPRVDLERALAGLPGAGWVGDKGKGRERQPTRGGGGGAIYLGQRLQPPRERPQSVPSGASTWKPKTRKCSEVLLPW